MTLRSTAGATVAGSGGRVTVIVTSAVVVSWPSEAERRSTWAPAVENVAVVVSAPASPNVTVPGPLTALHSVVSPAGGSGSPSSETVPVRAAAAGSVIVWSAPALTTGGWFTAGAGFTVTVTRSLELSAPSSAVSRRM